MAPAHTAMAVTTAPGTDRAEMRFRFGLGKGNLPLLELCGRGSRTERTFSAEARVNNIFGDILVNTEYRVATAKRNSSLQAECELLAGRSLKNPHNIACIKRCTGDVCRVENGLDWNIARREITENVRRSVRIDVGRLGILRPTIHRALIWNWQLPDYFSFHPLEHFAAPRCFWELSFWGDIHGRPDRFCGTHTRSQKAASTATAGNNCLESLV